MTPLVQSADIQLAIRREIARHFRRNGAAHRASPEDQEDLAQDATLRLLERGFPADVGCAPAYAAVVARRICVDERRRFWAVKNGGGVDAQNVDSYIGLQDHQANPETAYAAREALTRHCDEVREATDLDGYQLFRWVYLEELGTGEVGKRLELKRASVHSRNHRLREQLADAGIHLAPRQRGDGS